MSDPQYPYDPQYSGQPQYPYSPQDPYAARQPPPPGLPSRFADRIARRPAPRLGVSLAGVGAGLVIVGVIVWGVAYIAEGGVSIFGSTSSGSGSRHYLGALLAFLVLVIGYALATSTERGPLATAGIAASAFAVPVCLEFLTLDLNNTGGGSAVNLDATIWVSIAVWLVSYLFVRGTRGHSFYLGLIAIALWEYVLDKVAPSILTSLAHFQPVTAPLGQLGAPEQQPDFGTLAGVSLVFGAAYYLIAWALDRSGRRGAGVPFVLAGFPAVAVGIAALVPDLHQIGAGLLLVVVGVVLAGYGARFGRRFTTWVWAVGAAFGAALFVAKVAGGAGGPTTGLVFIVIGAVFVAGGALFARLRDEPDDMVPGAVVPSDELSPTGGR